MKNQNYEHELSFAKDLAVKAADIARHYYDEQPDFKIKTDQSPVGVADETINQMIIDAVMQEYPDHGVFGEEQSWQIDKKRLWICDPLDATMSFMMKMPTFMTAIALVDAGKPVVAVTINPVTNEMFWATRGGGSFKNGKAIHVSARLFTNAWLAFPTNVDKIIAAADIYQELKKQTYMADAIHGTVFKGMLIAQGSCDGSVWLGSVQPWDAAAVKLIVQEAGGMLTNYDGGDQNVNTTLTNGMVISNGVIHNDLLNIIRQHAAN